MPFGDWAATVVARMDRPQAIHALLATLFDYIPDPKTAALSGVSGPVEHSQAPCSLCSKSGRVGDRYCPVCDGTGWRRRRPWEEAFDRYTEEPVRVEGSGLGPVRDFRLDEDIRRLSYELERLDSQLSRPASRLEEQAPEEAWERRRVRQDRSGCYEPLRAIVRSLPAPLMALLHKRYWAAATCPLTSQEHRLLGSLLDYIGVRMPEVIVVPAWLGEREEIAVHQARQRTVSELVAEGATTRQIARALGVSFRRAKELRRSLRPVYSAA